MFKVEVTKRSQKSLLHGSCQIHQEVHIEVDTKEDLVLVGLGLRLRLVHERFL